MREYSVEVLDEDGGPDAGLRERFATCAARRLARLETNEGTYPEVGATFDILDAFEGPYVWEMSPDELEANPPSSVLLEVVTVDPVEPPADEGPAKVTVRVPF
jgi:hypothetical protein